MPVFPWLMHKRYGGHFWENVSIPLILHGSIAPPSIPTNIIIPGFLVSFASQFYALRYRPRWFEKVRALVQRFKLLIDGLLSLVCLRAELCTRCWNKYQCLDNL